MFTVILVPLDGSKRAEAILPHVENLALIYQARVIFLRVIEPSSPTISTFAIYTMLPQKAFANWETKEVRSYLELLEKTFRTKGIEVRTCWVHGRAIDEIINVAKREKVDLIAMTSHGRIGLTHVIFGSVTAGVLHQVDLPILLIRSLDDK